MENAPPDSEDQGWYDYFLGDPLPDRSKDVLPDASAEPFAWPSSLYIMPESPKHAEPVDMTDCWPTPQPDLRQSLLEECEEVPKDQLWEDSAEEDCLAALPPSHDAEVPAANVAVGSEPLSLEGSSPGHSEAVHLEPSQVLLAGLRSGSEERDRAKARATAMATMQRHEQEAALSPTIMIYDASMDPPSPSSPSSGKSEHRRRAYHVPLNGRTPTPFENEHFEGSFTLLHRVDQVDGLDDEIYPYASYFAEKTRRWEIRIQGRFRKRPKGKPYVGVCLQDFDYGMPATWSAAVLAGLGVPIIQSVLGQAVYFTWGDRGEDAARPDAEFASIMTDLCGFDQVIATAAGGPLPDLTGEISHLGYRRNAMEMEDYREAVARMWDNVNTEDVYTFGFWGMSGFCDMQNGTWVGINPFGHLRMKSFLEGWPLHFVFYFLEEDEDGDPRHLERRKSYFSDFMLWSSDWECPRLASRYDFFDERGSENRSPIHPKQALKLSGPRRYTGVMALLRRKFTSASKTCSTLLPCMR